MKKLSLLLLAFGILPTALYAASLNTSAATQQQALTTTTNQMVSTNTNFTAQQASFTNATLAQQKSLISTYSLAEQKVLLADSLKTSDEVVLTKAAVASAYPTLQVLETTKTSTQIPYFEFDGDLTAVSDFHLKYKLDDNGLMTKFTKDDLAAKDMAVLQSEFKISCLTHPQLCAVTSWNPETENKFDPFIDRAGFCKTYPSKCILKIDLAKKFILNNELIEPAVITRPATPILVSSFKCLGVKCGEGQYCLNGCCKYFKKISEDLSAIKEVTLADSVKNKYKIDTTALKLVALPAALKDGTAKLVIDSDVNRELILDKQIKMEKATQVLNQKIEALR